MAQFNTTDNYIEYKYIVQNESQHKVLWEEGENRYISLTDIKENKNEIFLGKLYRMHLTIHPPLLQI